MAWLALLSEVSFEGSGELFRGSREDRIARQTAGLEHGIGDVADKLSRVLVLEPERCIDSVFDRLRTRNFKQNHGIALLLPKIFKFVVAECELYSKTFFCKCLAQDQGGSLIVS